MRATFQGCRWSAKVTQPGRVTPLCPASWVSAVDKSRNSKSVEVTDMRGIYDHILQFIPDNDAGAIDGALVGGNPHRARDFWSAAAERALVTAFRMSGGPIPPRGLDVGRGKARFWTVGIGGKSMRRYRLSMVDPLDATEVHLYRSQSIAPLLAMKKET